MFRINRMHKDQSGQTALETAIILIAFVVVASVFAFTILSAGSASTEKGEQAIYSGLENVQSSMSVKGAVIAEGVVDGDVTDIVFTLSPVSGGDPINLDTVAKEVVIGYRDAGQFVPSLAWGIEWIVQKDAEDVADADALLEDGELAQITVYLTGTDADPALATPLAANTAFTLEVKPPTGAILAINRTTPAAIEAVMELR
jgi:flagellin FlaB